MPQPSRTTLADNVGPLQSFPFEHGMKESRELNHVNTYYVYNEGKQKLERMLINPADAQEMKIARELYDGVRVVCYHGMCYTSMSMTLKNKNTPEQAYDRAMAVIGKR